MAKSFLLEPGAIRERLATRFRQHSRHWLTGEDAWPLRLPLGVPSEREASAHLARVQAWQAQWAKWQGPGSVHWCERRWPGLGTQRLPESVTFDSPEQIVELIGHAEVWSQAVRRRDALAARWPHLRELATGATDLLMDWDDADFERLVALLGWLEANPRSGLYARQIPVSGLDSKWLETRRRVLATWLRALLGSTDSGDFHELAGLRRPPQLLRMRLLDPDLRRQLGGLGDIQAPVPELAALDLPVRRVFIVENLQTGLAFESIPGAVLFMRQGYAVEPFADLPWLRDVPCHYWGDLDTHGFAILDRLRLYLPDVQSLLMDEDTLLAHRSLWGHEGSPTAETELPRLDTREREVFHGLKSNRWGPGVRLEQERIDWAYALGRLSIVSGARP
nr:Wadjet anti-phage system protein JetD domain-containing protein [Thioalkalivibrio sp.]